MAAEDTATGAKSGAESGATATRGGAAQANRSASAERFRRWGESGAWGGRDEEPVVPLTRDQAAIMRARNPSVSPWQVLGVQALVGVLAALLAGWLWGEEIVWSVLYGAATVVVPGALLARGMTSRLSSVSPMASAASFMLWEMVKIGVSVALLMLAPKLVPHLNWLALLAGVVLCMKLYWVALLWRGRGSDRKLFAQRTGTQGTGTQGHDSHT